MKTKILSAMLAAALAAIPMGLPPTDASAAGDLTPGAIISRFNAERLAHGLPPVSERPDWSDACAKHNRWMRLNNQMTHYETAGTPGFTRAGEWAGRNAVLAATSWRHGNPYRLAPLHLAQLMSPDLRYIGAAESYGYNCMTTWPGYESGSAAAGFAWFPGPNQAVAAQEVAYEEPIVPQVWVGIPEGRPTGPHLYLYRRTSPEDPEPAVSSVRLVGREGNVAVKVVTEPLAARRGWPGYLATYAMLIPVRPLKPDSWYTATVRTSADEVAALRFRTTGPSSSRNQAIRSVKQVVRPGARVRLPATSTRNLPIRWKSTSPRICRVKVKTNRLVARRTGTCRLKATAPATPFVDGVTYRYRVLVR